MELFCYAPVADVPDGVTVRNAAEILPCKEVYLYRGGHAEVSAPSLHSNLFRYRLLRDHGGWWIDADVLLLDGKIPAQAPVFARENWVEISGGATSTLGYSTAVMNFSAGADIMVRAYAETEALVAGNPVWGQTGPFLFTRLVEELSLSSHALPEAAVNALTHREAHKFVRTENREEVQRRTRGAPFVHLFQHALRREGDADELPPPGSFLADQLRAIGLTAAQAPERSAMDTV
jgi:hypothetical protein